MRNLLSLCNYPALAPLPLFLRPNRAEAKSFCSICPLFLPPALPRRRPDCSGPLPSLLICHFQTAFAWIRVTTPTSPFPFPGVTPCSHHPAVLPNTGPSPTQRAFHFFVFLFVLLLEGRLCFCPLVHCFIQFYGRSFKQTRVG